MGDTSFVARYDYPALLARLKEDGVKDPTLSVKSYCKRLAAENPGWSARSIFDHASNHGWGDELADARQRSRLAKAADRNEVELAEAMADLSKI